MRLGKTRGKTLGKTLGKTPGKTAALLAAGLIAATAAIVQGPQPRADAQPAQLNLTLAWQRSFPGVSFLESSPTPASLSTPAVVVGGLDGNVYAFDEATGATEPGWPVATGDPINGSPAAADVDGSGHDRVFIGSGAAIGSNACSGGGTFGIGYAGNVIWHNTLSDADCASLPFQSSFTIGDVTGAGLPDATIGALGLQSPSYNAVSGVMNPGWPFFTDDTVFSTPALDAISGSGPPDIIVGGDASPGDGSFQGGMLRAISGAGQLLWQYDIDEQVASSPAVGDLGNGGPTIVFGTGQYWELHGGASDSTSLFALNNSGRLQWRENLQGATVASPALADVDGTGSVDVVEGTAGTPSDPNTGLVWAFNNTGTALPQWAGHPSGGGVVIGGISTADLSGDGAQDLLVPTGAGVFIYDGPTGDEVGSLDVGQVGFQNTPLVADDGNGTLGITVAGTTPGGTGIVQHWTVQGGQLGTLGWPMFHHDPAHTGDLNLAPAAPPSCVASALPTPPTGKVTRLAGANRDATGVATSQAAFPAAHSAHVVVLASDATYPDALSGGPLAAADGGPLLVTTPSGLNPIVNTEIQRVLPPLGTVDIVGGDDALSSTIDAQLSSEGFVVQRIAGANRAATAVAVAGALKDPGTVFEVTGFNYPDALSAAPAAAHAGAAILLTDNTDQDPATAAYLSAHAPKRYAIGGPAAAADPQATPIAGADRYATSVMVATTFFSSPTTVGFATGEGFADALTGGAMLAGRDAPVVLVPPCGALPAETTQYVQSVAGTVQAGLLFGGTAAVGDDVLGELDTALG